MALACIAMWQADATAPPGYVLVLKDAKIAGSYVPLGGSPLAEGTYSLIQTVYKSGYVSAGTVPCTRVAPVLGRNATVLLLIAQQALVVFLSSL